jgi:hypothetical protein
MFIGVTGEMIIMKKVANLLGLLVTWRIQVSATRLF